MLAIQPNTAHTSAVAEGPLTVKTWVNLTTWPNSHQDAPDLTVGSITVILTLKVARQIFDKAQLPSDTLAS
ncbi:hypothetical protein PCANC_11253 [Puccinia coronata f. sp. avenae]|uniref:Uncharacterized protein n=1 Tax=Puccinia coronata f. sp. avenae TaxID=200324 RepID=A0A2N5T631_9BASI|nr:hypothetical protein PCANC_11253 [Puccinia coronata f. sp. avenae]